MREIDLEFLLSDDKIIHPVIVSHITDEKVRHEPIAPLDFLLSDEVV